MNILAILEGIISSVPAAIDLWNKVAPLIDEHVNIPQEKIDAIKSLVPEAHLVVKSAHDAVATLITTHAAE